ncbi:MAG TPA: zinc-ribbon domain-containing protein [Myxococcota bacterium]
MRIDCEQCGAAFSIDDALITERGVRAQCPKCGKQRVVKKPAAGAADPFSASPTTGAGLDLSQPSSSPAPPGNPFAAPGVNPFAAAPSSSSGAGSVQSQNPFAAGNASNPFGTFPPAPGANGPTSPSAQAGPTSPSAQAGPTR